MATRRDPYTQQALNLATVQFGPQESVLAALLREAEERRDTARRQAKSARQFGVGAVDQAIPRVQQAYAGAQAAVDPAFQSGGGVEAGAMRARMQEALALQQSQLQARRVGAVQGEHAARAQAERDFRSDRQKVLARAQDLGVEKGAFTASTISDMRSADAAARAGAAEKQADRDQRERDSLRRSGIDPDTGRPIPGGKLDPRAKGNRGRGWAPQKDQAEAADTVGLALKWARQLKKQGIKRGAAAEALAVGVQEETADVIDPVTGKPALWTEGETDPETGQPVDPMKVNTPKKRVLSDALPQIESQLLLTAALDMAYDGHLSRRTQRLLHERGIKLGPLGLKTYGQWRKERMTRALTAPTPDQQDRMRGRG